MKKRVSVLLFLTVVFLQSLQSSVFAQQLSEDDYLSVFELVDECDLLAAHPSDPERMSDGVPEGALIPKLAHIACADAVEREPDNPRFLFQLARAYNAQNKKEAALLSLKKASSLGYAAASAMLGEIIWETASTKEDAQLAIGYFESARAGGYSQASSLVAKATPMPKLFVAQSIVSTLYSGNANGLNGVSDDARVKSYLFNFASTLMEACPKVLSPHAIPGLYLFRFPGGQIEQESNDVSIEIQAEVGTYDASTFVNRHGCNGVIAITAFETLDSFFRG